MLSWLDFLFGCARCVPGHISYAHFCGRIQLPCEAEAPEEASEPFERCAAAISGGQNSERFQFEAVLQIAENKISCEN
jgi:hypothetical protein